MANPFTVDVFIICFRESLEAAVILSVLLSFVKQSFGGEQVDRKAYKRMLWHIWLGAALGLFLCLVIGCAFIGAFYALNKDIWGSSEDLWEGILCLIAAIMITIMGLGMLRINKMQEKWRVKIARAILEEDERKAEENNGLPLTKGQRFKRAMNIKRYNPVNFRFAMLSSWGRKYALFLLPFITVLREGVEAVVFVGGVGVGKPATQFPLSVILGLLCGFVSGYVLYKVGNVVSMRYFLIASTCFLYLIASGLFSRSVWFFQSNRFNKKTGGDASESGSGPGSYDISETVWHVNCCNPELNNNGWGIFNALLGWQNTATYGSVISYNVYWIFIMISVAALIYEEKTGQFPLIGRFYQRKVVSKEEADDLYNRAKIHARTLGREGGDVEVHSEKSAELSSSKTPSETKNATQTTATAAL